MFCLAVSGAAGPMTGYVFVLVGLLTYMALVAIACMTETPSSMGKEAHMNTEETRKKNWFKTITRAVCSTNLTIGTNMWSTAALSG